MLTREKRNKHKHSRFPTLRQDTTQTDRPNVCRVTKQGEGLLPPDPPHAAQAPSNCPVLSRKDRFMVTPQQKIHFCTRLYIMCVYILNIKRPTIWIFRKGENEETAIFSRVSLLQPNIYINFLYFFPLKLRANYLLVLKHNSKFNILKFIINLIFLC